MYERVREGRMVKNVHKACGVYEKFFKRPLDFLCGIAAILSFWWLYLLIALLVRIKLGSPVLFSQERPGKDEKVFRLYKFRTMTDEKNNQGELLPDEDRLTGFGRMLRSTSLDELPEIFNIIKGDMSWVGPRPLLVKYLPYYNELQHRRHEVRPGLSGYAQVNGRNSISWDERFELDLIYVDNITFMMDMKIIGKTIVKVFKREGVSASNAATMEGFAKYIKHKEEG